MLEMLMDKSTYETIKNNEDRTIVNKIKRLCQNSHVALTKSEENYLTSFEPKTSQFYGLPKIHKCPEIINAINESNSEYVKVENPPNLKFRPIVAGPACPTHRLSHLLDILLTPYVKHVSTFIRDDIDFLNHLPETISENEMFASFDVTSLYSNISHTLGLEAIEFWLEKYPEDHNDRFPPEFIMEAIKLILNNNTFMFGSKNFKQVLGTAMGTKFAPTYATLVLGYLETKLYDTLETNYGVHYSVYIKNNFKRFLDDCFICWDKTKGNIEDFHKILNSLDTNINFTLETSSTQLPFLDILLKRGANNSLITDIYHKPTDTKQYLDFNSCHPRHTKINVPYNLARRICCIVTNSELRHIRLNELQSNLVKRNYPKEVIKMGIDRAKNLDLHTLRTPRERQQSNSISFVETYNPNYESFSKTINSTLTFLDGSARMKEVLKDKHIIHSKRQAPSLKNILTKAKFEENDKTYTTSKCGNGRCKCCENIIETSSYHFSDINLEFQIRSDMNCNSRNLIYVLFCNGCNQRYVGQSGDELRSRCRVHRQHISNPEDAPLFVSKHIKQCAGSLEPSFRILPIYKMKTEDKDQRIKMEMHFITKLCPSLNMLTH